jgi:hypothetical protein
MTAAVSETKIRSARKTKPVSAAWNAADYAANSAVQQSWARGHR